MCAVTKKQRGYTKRQQHEKAMAGLSERKRRKRLTTELHKKMNDTRPEEALRGIRGID